MKKISKALSVILLVTCQMSVPITGLAETNSQNNTNASNVSDVSQSTEELNSTIEASGNNEKNISSSNSVSEFTPASGKNNVDNAVTKDTKSSSKILDYTDIDISSNDVSSKDNPFTLKNNFITYNIKIKNTSSTGEVIPSGTKISLDVYSPVKTSSILKLRGLQTATDLESYFSASAKDDSFYVNINKDLGPGEYNLNLYLSIDGPDWNWDGLANATDPAGLEATLTASLVMPNIGSTEELDITPALLFMKPLPHNNVIGDLAGFSNGGYNNTELKSDGSIGLDNGYPSNYIIGNEEGLWFNPSVEKVGGKYYQTFIGAYLPAQLGVGKPIGLTKGEITLSFDHPVDEKSVRVTLGGTGNPAEPPVDITNEPGVNLSISNDKKTITAEFSQFMQNSAPYLVNQWRTVNLITAIPLDSINGIVNGKFNLKYPGVDWNSSFKGLFQDIDSSDNEYPYFRGNDITIYNNDSSYNPLTDVHSFIGKENNDHNISITNLNGYPVDGVNPKPGTYTIEYQAGSGNSNLDYVAKFSRVITVLDNKQSFTASNFKMTKGSKEPTVSDFKASATDKNGNSVEVTADFSKVDFNTIGVYDVTLNTADGQSKVVKLTIEDKKADTVKVTFNTGKGGSLQGTTTMDVPKGTKVTDLPKTVADKSNIEDIYFLDWYQNGKVVNPKTVTINSDTTFTAKFGAAVYRLYNKNNGDHLLTKNKDEKNKIAAKGWKVETNPKNEYGRAAFYVPVQADSAGKKQVYRIYNPNSGEHFYTTNKSEADAAVKKGWRHETDRNYTWVSEGDVRIYREFNPDVHTAGSHNFTTDLKEHQNVVKAGWRDESKDSSLWTVLKAGF